MSELMVEWDYIFHERIGILAGAEVPEPWMEALATKDAQEAVEALLRAERERTREWRKPGWA